MQTIKLNKPLKIDGEEITEITFDLDELTGNDIQNAIKELRVRKIPTTVTELDTNYHIAVLSIATGISFEDLGRMGAKDYVRTSNMVRDFFLADTTES